MNEEKKLSQQLREARLAQKKTIKSVAQETGISVPIIRGLERERVLVPTSILVQLLTYYGLSPEMIFFEVVSEEKGKPEGVLPLDKITELLQGFYTNPNCVALDDSRFLEWERYVMNRVAEKFIIGDGTPLEPET